jgi:WD40 repeat protein
MRFLVSILLFAFSVEAAPLSIAPLNRTTPVNFEHEILPFLKQNCLACHNQTKAKADLILETPQTILKGGESGPAVVPGKPDESLLLDAAAHEKKPFMPPADNKVNASDLTADQLALLKLWIEQGATGEVRGAHSIVWRSLSEKVRPILSLAVTPDGQFAACGRGNELLLYQLATERSVGPLVDPELIKSGSGHSNAAHLDLVESLDFSPDGELLASGSYREVKLWRRQHYLSHAAAPRDSATLKPEGVPILATSSEAKRMAMVGADNTIRIWSLDGQKLLSELRGDYPSNYRVAQLQRALTRSTNYLAYRKSSVEKAEKERQSQVERVRKAGETVGVAQKAFADQEKQVAAVKTEETAAQKELAGIQAKLKEAQTKAEKLQADLQAMKAAIKDTERDALTAKLDEFAALAANSAVATNALAQLKVETDKNEKAADEKIKGIQKRVKESEALLKRTQLTNSATENELHFAITAAQNAFDTLTLAQNNLQLAESDLKQNEMQLDSARNALTNSFNPTRALAFSPDGKLLAAASDRKSVTFWAVETAAPLETISLPYTAAELSFRDSNTLVTYGEGKAHAWAVAATWKLERVIATSDGQPAFADRVNALRFSPDGQFLATGGGEPSRSGELKIWRVRDGQLVQDFKSLHSDTVLALAYSPDGRYLASGAADRFAKITELSTGKTLRVLEGHSHHVLSVGWKSDGHTIVTGGADNLVKIWDAFSGEKKKGPDALTKEVTALGYLAQGDELLAGAGDSNLRLIKENGDQIRAFEGASGYLQAAVTTADARLVLAGGQDGVLRVWLADSGKLMSEYH